jgi:hypothetical protein
VLHKTLLPDPFTDLSADDVKARRAPGAYLHWALPDALTRGAQSAAGTTAFPAVPDRWLIVRLSPSLRFANRRAVRGWVLQAGDETPQPLPLATWKEPEAPPTGRQSPLTALGIGDLSWAGYFDNVQNRLGFYDPLTDVREGPVAYLVCGWYSDPQLDPLGDSQVKSLTDFDAKMARLGWALPDGDLTEAQRRAGSYTIAANSVGLATRAFTTRLALDRVAAQASLASPAALAQSGQPANLGLTGIDLQAGSYTTNGSWWPQLTVYHGAVVGIGWPGLGWPGNPTGVYQAPPLIDDPTALQEEGGPPAASAIHVVVGNTMTEALARLVAQKGDATDEARILEAFQLGLLPELDKPDGAAQIDTFLHASAFGSLPGDTSTEVIDEPPQSVNQAPPANPPQPGPGVFPPASAGRSPVLQTAAASRVSRLTVASSAPKLPVREIKLTTGNLASILAAQTPAAPPPDPGGPRTVNRAQPRFFHPTDPVILLQGGKASFKHASSGRFNPEGLLVCRLTGDHATELASRLPGPAAGAGLYQSVKPEDLLESGVENGSVPPECEGLLQELAVLDPGSSAAAAAVAAGPNAGAAEVASLARSFLVEQTAWHAVRDSRVDSAPLLALSGISGRLPSAVAITLPARPWNPIHLDWAVELLPSTDGAADWRLDEIDYQASAVESGPPLQFQGRSPLTQGASQTAAAAIRKAVDQIGASGGNAVIDPSAQYSARSLLSQQMLARVAVLQVKSAVGNLPQSGNVPAIDRGPLDDIASALESMDVLTGGLDGLLTDLRGGFLGDGVAAPAAGAAGPSPFLPFRAGFLRIVRLRLVDGFGQYLDLLGSGPQTAVDPQALLKTDAIAVPGHPELLAQPPRFTSPARLWFRYTAADGSGTDAGAAVTPVCGFLMPNHLDGALELFGPDGANQGVVRRVDDGNVLWEDAPGVPSTVGQSPALAVANPFCAAVAQSLIDWGIADAGVPAEQDTALAALLRVIDSTLWSVDPFGHTGDEHTSLLLGHPVVVMRAVLRLEIREPIHPEALATLRVPVRLGALTHWQDGLLGYFVDDDYDTLFCADAAAAGMAREVGPNRGFLQQANLVQGYYDGFAGDLPAGAVTGGTPVTHPYIDTSGVVFVQPNQDVRLTLLVEPHTGVNATTGLLPRKEIGMRREWVADGLAKLAPTFRFGPLLVDPKRIRMPIPTDLDGSWTWTYRADATTWAELPVTNATQDALLPPDPPSGTEGWLRLNPPAPGGTTP